MSGHPSPRVAEAPAVKQTDPAEFVVIVSHPSRIQETRLLTRVQFDRMMRGPIYMRGVEITRFVAKNRADRDRTMQDVIVAHNLDPVTPPKPFRRGARR